MFLAVISLEQGQEQAVDTQSYVVVQWLCSNIMADSSIKIYMKCNSRKVIKLLKEYKTLSNKRPLMKIQLKDPPKGHFWKIEYPSCIGVSMVYWIIH